MENFYRLWTTQLDDFLKGYIYSEKGRINLKREAFTGYQELLKRFFSGKIKEIEKINLLAGIRGVGKTTLLAQLFYTAKNLRGGGEPVFLDVSRLSAEKISLKEFFDYYAKIKNFHWETLTQKTAFFLDEVHYDPDWGLFLKNLFDRTKAHRNLLVLATGSSALKIKLNPDLSRRSLVKEIYPLVFSEYLSLKNGLTVPLGLSKKLADEILSGRTAEATYRAVKARQGAVNRFFSRLPAEAESGFFESGGFPFVIKSRYERRLARELILGVIEKLIAKDILELRRFNAETIAKIYDILYLIAVSDTTDYAKLCTAVRLDYRSARAVIEALVKSGILFNVKAYGAKFVKVRKPAKLLFISPSLRVSLLKGILPPEIKGKLLEDYSALVFKKNFNGEVGYDSAAAGADFVLRGKTVKKRLSRLGSGLKPMGLNRSGGRQKN